MEDDNKGQREKTLFTNDKKDLESRSNPSSWPGAHDSAAEVTPGAVAVPGNSGDRGTSNVWDDEDNLGNVAPSGDYVIPEDAVRTVTIRADEVRTVTNDMTSNKILAEVRKAVLQDTVQAEIVKDDSANSPPKSSLSWRKVGVYAILAAIVVGVAIFLLVFFLVRDKKTSPTSAPLSSPPSSTDTQPKDPSCIYCVENATYDFPLNSSLSIIQLLDAAPNHTTFSEILKITGINEYLDANHSATLFAPTNEAFNALPFPYHYYVFTYDWIYHLVALIFSHMVEEPLNATEIFGYDELPVGGGFNLTVNRANKTIADLAKILIADVPATNGYIHVPDRVLLIDELRSTLLDTANIRAYESNFTFFQKLIEFAQVEEFLKDILRFGLTLFAPSDSAFDALDQEFVQGLLSPGNENKTRDIVLYHLLRFNLYQDVIIQFNQNLNITEVGDVSYNNLSLWFTADVNENEPSVSFVNTARIHDQYWLAQNGLVNVIDKVLMPPTIDDLLRTTTNVTISFSFATFLGIIDGPAQLSAFFTQDGPLTLFAPLEVAFNSSSAQLRRWLEPGWLLHLQSFVRHHCVAREIRNSELEAGIFTLQTLSGFNTTMETLSNGNSTLDDLTWGSLIVGDYFTSPNITLEDGPNVTLKNLFATNGILYGIDGLLLPPWTKSDIHQTLAQKNEFSTFLALAEFANVTSFLAGSGPFTVLAPNNTALAAVVGDNIDVASLNVTVIREVVLQHIFEGNLYTPQLQASIVSASGDRFQGYTLNSQVFVDGARILESDVLCNNGVIHVVDELMQVRF